MRVEHVRIEFRCAEGALRRILGVIEARAFAVRSMQMGSDGDRSVMTLALEPLDESRRVDTLLRQVARLHEVETTIRLTNAPPVMEVAHVATA
ncbi:MAG: hypothetical protein CL808_02310 [Citromicrobium sp.]|nr:hypothetical protein [Citromicrobium sp.]|tara:strand:+ start:239 stop:517 length:279 start_codon:yes stop_codon:yes gene_type:complete